MRINQIFENDNPVFIEYKHLLSKIAKECSSFLREAQELPVFKQLPTAYNDIQKIKVRKHRDQTKFSQTFNDAFVEDVRDLRQRAVFTNSRLTEHVADADLFYVFPKNGYNFMYSAEVKHSSNDYQQVFDSLFEQFDNEKAEQIIHDLLKFTYTRENLFEGIKKEVEVIFYNIPYYYAARVDAFEYDVLLSDISELGNI